MRNFLRWLCLRCPLNPIRIESTERRKVSPEGRERYEEFCRERGELEHRLELVEMQRKVLAHVTNGTNGTAPAAAPAAAPNGSKIP